MICPKCGGDTFIMVSDVGLKCENCGYVYSIERKKMNKHPFVFQHLFILILLMVDFLKQQLLRNCTFEREKNYDRKNNRSGNC